MTKDNEIQVSFLILTWNSAKFIEKCFASLEDGAAGLPYEVIVVDNGSSDNTVELINSTCPRAIIIRNLRNEGTTVARNQGISRARGNFIVVLDSDTYLMPETVSKVVSYMLNENRIAICAPRLRYEDGSIQENARRFPTVITKLLRRIDTKWAENKLYKEEYYDLKNVQSPIKVDYAITACHIIRKDALSQIGGFDEKIFYAPEDIDLCLRMWLAGWEVVYYPYAEAVHYEQRITKKKFFSWMTLEHIKGLVYFFIKHGYFLNTQKLYRRIK
ncbi:MAG: glycosyltransferase family 2 protein [Ignavibacteriales bacterium]